MKHLPLPASLFAGNRNRFSNRLKPGSIAIFTSNYEWPSNGDALHTYRQNSDLYWLTGIQQEETQLVFFPDNPDPLYREVLVITRPDELKEKWDGKRLRKEEATAISGVKTILYSDQLPALLQTWIHLSDIIYLNTNENDRKSVYIPGKQDQLIQDIRRMYPLHQYERSAKILKELRAVKSPEELAVIRHAISITEDTFRHLLTEIKAGIYEHEIEASIYHQFLRRRSAGPAYGSIIASGDAARTLHYVENNAECRDGDLILMDFGAEYGGYCADLTRTVPVNGRFTDRQRALYNGCLRLHNFAKGLLRPGITLVDYTEKVGEEATLVFQELGLLSKEDMEANPKEAYRKYLYHGISHHLGLDVHDLGTRTGPLQPGMVLTVEPGIYVEAEKTGIRIENNVVITEDGNEDLMAGIPITAEEIEKLMQVPSA